MLFLLPQQFRGNEKPLRKVLPDLKERRTWGGEGGGRGEAFRRTSGQHNSVFCRMPTSLGPPSPPPLSRQCSGQDWPSKFCVSSSIGWLWSRKICVSERPMKDSGSCDRLTDVRHHPSRLNNINMYCPDSSLKWAFLRAMNKLYRLDCRSIRGKTAKKKPY